ncbi:MAG TPA: sigma-70 family RNA polymerase sigma factor [Bryobacteraceae bacterium]
MAKETTAFETRFCIDIVLPQLLDSDINGLACNPRCASLDHPSQALRAGSVCEQLKRESRSKTVMEYEKFFVLHKSLRHSGHVVQSKPTVRAVKRTRGGNTMAAPSPEGVTQLLKAWGNGEQQALDRLIPIVYTELHRLAHRYMERERRAHTLQPTALVHEAYERLIDLKHVSWHNRAHFFAVSAQLMRRILVDYARSRRYSKRGGEWRQVRLNEAVALFRDRQTDIVALDDALRTLSDIDPRKGRVVEMRFFGGLSITEVAEVLNVSQETVLRDWRLAKVWLLRELSQRNSE